MGTAGQVEAGHNLQRISRIRKSIGALRLSGDDIGKAMCAFRGLDWGEVPESMKQRNQLFLEQNKGHVRGFYYSSSNVRFYILSSEDHTHVVIFLPDEEQSRPAFS